MTLTNTNHNLAALKQGCDEILAFKHAEFSKHYERILVQKHPNASLSPLFYRNKYGADLNCIVQLGIQGIKGAFAYAEHVYRLVN